MTNIFVKLEYILYNQFSELRCISLTARVKMLFILLLHYSHPYLDYLVNLLL